GAFTGAAVWRALEPFAPAIPDSPAPFVIVGMMACFGPICRAPLAVILMVAEMAGSITTLIPALVAVGLSYLIVNHFGETIYRSQLTYRFSHTKCVVTNTERTFGGPDDHRETTADAPSVT